MSDYQATETAVKQNAFPPSSNQNPPAVYKLFNFSSASHLSSVSKKTPTNCGEEKEGKKRHKLFKSFKE